MCFFGIGILVYKYKTSIWADVFLTPNTAGAFYVIWSAKFSACYLQDKCGRLQAGIGVISLISYRLVLLA